MIYSRIRNVLLKHASGLEPAENFLMQHEHVVRDDEVVTNLQLRTRTPKLLFLPLPPHGTRDSQGPPRAIEPYASTRSCVIEPRTSTTPPQASQIDCGTCLLHKDSSTHLLDQQDGEMEGRELRVGNGYPSQLCWCFCFVTR